jgi:PA14 domain
MWRSMIAAISCMYGLLGVAVAETCGLENFCSYYYNERDFTQLVVNRIDPYPLNFDWGAGAPVQGMGPNTFAVASTGNFTFVGGTYKFTATADDGIKVSVDGNVIINAWFDQPATTYTATIDLSPGVHRVDVHYYEKRGQAVLKLAWALTGAAAPPPPPSISMSLTYNGRTRDVVSPGENFKPDGRLDAGFGIALSASKTVTQLRFATPNGIWDTVPGNATWVAGVSDPAGNLLNFGGTNINATGAAFVAYLSDNPTPTYLVSGMTVTLEARFSDGSTATAFAVITDSPPPTICPVAGGKSTSPTALGSFIANNTQCAQFNLGDGYYSPTTISRSNIIIKANTRCMAVVQPELSIQGQNVTVDGLSVTAAGVAVTVHKSGVRVLNSCIQDFGKTQYGNGIWIFQEALDPNNKITISGNELSNWGGAMYSGGIAIGKADDNYGVPTAISVDILYNRITGGPTKVGIYNAAIQSFHPFLAYGNYIHTVSGTAFQNKAFNSRVACNEAVNVIGDGALYNRLSSNNIWEYNIVHDSDVGIDHFMGDHNIFRGNVIYNVDYLGRVKNQGIGSTNLIFENNTFYDSVAWAGFIWDATSSGPLNNILWRKNIFHTVNGSAINTSSSLSPVWDETENIFFGTRRPSGTTGASGTSSTIDPKLADPPNDFSVLEPRAAGKGAPWPLQPLTPTALIPHESCRAAN